MIIAVTAADDTLGSSLDPRFGRCSYFLIVETDDLSFEPMANPNVSRDSGAGIQAAQILANMGVRFVVTGNCGPNAYQTLTAAGIGVIIGCSGTVRTVIDEFKAGRHSTAQQPNVTSHFGVGAVSSASVDSPAEVPSKSDFAMGMGTGRGRRGGLGPGMDKGGAGMGMGQGAGRGMGRGAGRGMGRGMGRGGGQGMGRGRMARDPAPDLQSQTTSQPPPETPQDLDSLKTQARAVEAQLAAMKDETRRIGQAATSPRLVAVVDSQRCLACGGCIQSCPEDAITLATVAAIDPARCTACGQCVAACPQEAIVLKAWRE